MAVSCSENKVVDLEVSADDTQAQSPWPSLNHRVQRDEEIEAKIDALMAKMSLRHKVGQMTQAEITFITIDQVKDLHIGSLLNGGDSFVNGDKSASVDDWVDYMDAIYEASMDTTGGRLAIPITYGTDAVHGNSKLGYATLFPHNIGLGATRNPRLMTEIGKVTATEVLATGIDWTFAPTLAVTRNDRWGRTYESYSENPDLVGELGAALVEGIQGQPESDTFLGENNVYATAKHWLGDGGTVDGIDQGDNVMNEKDLVELQAKAYFSTIEAGVQSIMISHSHWHGLRMHGHDYLVNDVLKGQLGFDGFVISDWNAHGRVQGCTNSSCPAAINAGLDMFMVTEEFEDFINNTVAQVESGEIPLARIDDAVRRILRVKFRSGLFDGKAPSERQHARNAELVGSAEHRAIARQAARESLVLLKNNNGLLPLSSKQHIVVAGDGANNISKQSGGWSMTWQGTGNTNEDFKGATSIFDGLAQEVKAAGGSIELAEDGEFKQKPDVAILVFGEEPYAEWQGDIENIIYSPSNAKDRELLADFKAKGIPVVSVFLSGRPLWVNRELNLSDAFIAAWLPGSEGGAIADVLLSDAENNVKFDFSGKLSFSWPAKPSQEILNVGDENYQPLFAYGYGLTYDDNVTLADLDETIDIALPDSNDADLKVLAKGLTVPWQWYVFDGSDKHFLNSTRFESDSVKLQDADRLLQGDSIEFRWKKPSLDANALPELGICSPWHFEQADIFTEQAGEIQFDIKLLEAPTAPVILTIGQSGKAAGEIDISALLSELTLNDWHSLKIPVGELVESGANLSQMNMPFVLKTAGTLWIRLNGLAYKVGDAISDC